MANSTTRAKTDKPNKPSKNFPLTPHPTGYWVKRINNRLERFGRWGHIRKGKMVRLPGDGWQEALALYKLQKDDLYAGRKPRQHNEEGLTIRELANRFLDAKHDLLENAEIVPRTFNDYKRVTDRIVSALGKERLVADLDPDDFAALRKDIAKTCGPVRLSGMIQQIRMVFKFGYDSGLLDKPIRFGPGFKRPSKRVMRKQRNEGGERMFEAAEIRRMLDAAPTQLKAMILLGVNCGFGNHDCGTLPLKALNLKTGWVNYPRPKTHIKRRCKLWPETVAALNDVIESRPTPKHEADAGLVFITKYGGSWAKDTSANPVSAEMRKLLQAIDTKAANEAEESGTKPPPMLYRKGRTFYGLRRTTETIGGEAKDQIAVNHIMGHVDDSMAAVYRERLSDERLEAVAAHIRTWLFGEGHADG